VKKSLLGLMLASLGISTLSSLWSCGFAGISDVITLSSRSSLAELKSSGRIPNPMHWAEIQNDLQAASILSPSNPLYYEDQAYLYSVRGVAARRFPEIADLNLQQAERFYYLSIKARPMTSATWANLALVSYYLDPGNSVSINKLYNVALSYGPSSQSTFITLFYLDLLRWNTLSDSRRGMLKDMKDSSQKSVKEKLQLIASQLSIDDF